MTSRYARDPAFAVMLLGVVLLSGCIEWLDHDVASGVARLTVRNFSAISNLVVGDPHCGLESRRVAESPIVDGVVGSRGTVTYRTENCTIELGDYTEIVRDCDNDVLSASGTITVSAEQVIEGLLTGDIDKPVIPTTAEAGTVHIRDARFHNFRVVDSASTKAMTMIEGSVSGSLTPRLAKSASLGACSIVSRHLWLEDITYGPSKLHVDSPAISFDVDVQHSRLSSQAGRGDTHENYISGTVTVWESEVQVPTDGEGLDPDYDAAIYVDKFACDDDLVQPISYDCSLDTFLGEAAARLSMKTLAGVVSAINDDPACGFASDPVNAGVVVHGTVGDPGGSAVYTVEACTLDFAEPTPVSSNCDGESSLVQGRIQVSGTKTLHGYLTGDPTEPVVPDNRSPAVISLDVEFTDFRSSDDGSDTALTVRSGSFAAQVQPRTALDAERGVCSIVTPVSVLDVRWKHGDLVVESGGLRLGVSVGSSDLHAINGRVGVEENSLSGSLRANGANVEIPAGSQLDPDYHPYLFDLGYQCDANMIVPAADDDCALTGTLAQNSARLLIKSFGMLATALSQDASCGFASVDGVLPENAESAPGDELTAVWQVESCRIGGGEPISLGENCSGVDTYLLGSVTASASKTVTGRLALGYPPIEPTRRDAARVDVHLATLEGFSIREFQPGAPEPGPYLEIHHATVSGATRIMTGEAADRPGAYTIATPVAGFERIRVTDALATLHFDGKQLNLRIETSDLDAFNGTYDGQSNSLTGTVVVDGKRVAVPVDPDDPGLDPEFDQASFDAGYACKENLAAPIP